MGRRRKDGDPLGLAGTRLSFRRGSFFYIHREDGRWENVGTDVEQAKQAASRYNNPGDGLGTMAYWFRLFLADCKARVKAGTMSQRTLDDYTAYAADDGPLVTAFGKRFPEQITPALEGGGERRFDAHRHALGASEQRAPSGSRRRGFAVARQCVLSCSR